MVIVQELYSKTGFFRVKRIKCEAIKPLDNLILSFTAHSNGILIYPSKYVMVFRSAAIRDKVCLIIKKALDDKEDLRIPLELYYETHLTREHLIRSVKKYRFETHLKIAAEAALKISNKPFEWLLETDAFKNLSKNQLKKFKDGEKIDFNNEQIEIFSKTLQYPKELHSHISPYQFWSTIYELRRPTAATSSTDSATGDS